MKLTTFSLDSFGRNGALIKKVFEKIRRKFLCLEVREGGLKMISIKDQQKVYNIKWISKVAKQNDSPISQFANLFLENLGGIQYATKSTLQHPELIFDKAVNNWFWKNAACSWSSFNHILNNNTSSVQSMLLQPIILNSNLTYKK